MIEVPYSLADVKHFTKKATTPKKKRQWKAVQESAESRGASSGSAIRQANAVVKRSQKHG
jgi:hypothetical protein